MAPKGEEYGRMVDTQDEGRTVGYVKPERFKGGLKKKRKKARFYW
jgi:hypothetical protein